MRRCRSGAARTTRCASASSSASGRCPCAVLFSRVDAGLHDWELRLATLTPTELERVGRHPLRGEMRVADMLEPFCLGHAEGHVEQIETILAASGR